MPNNTTLNLIIDILQNACDIGKDVEINVETRFVEDLALDSMGMLALSAELENRLERVLSYNFENPPLCVGDLITLIEQEKVEVADEDSL